MRYDKIHFIVSTEKFALKQPSQQIRNNRTKKNISTVSTTKHTTLSQSTYESKTVTTSIYIMSLAVSNT